jgi:hypothetical protein
MKREKRSEGEETRWKEIAKTEGPKEKCDFHDTLRTGHPASTCQELPSPFLGRARYRQLSLRLEDCRRAKGGKGWPAVFEERGAVQAIRQGGGLVSAGRGNITSEGHLKERGIS